MNLFKLMTASILIITGINTKAEVAKVQATENKTTSIMFPAGIVHVDLGCESPFIAINVDENVPNLVKIRLSSGFKGTVTNLLVVTQDENVYSFEIEYADTIQKYVHIIKRENAVNFVSKTQDTNVPVSPKTKVDTLSAQEILDRILNSQDGFTRSAVVKKGKVMLCLKNIYVYNNDLYFHIEIVNKSNLKYNIDFYNFFMTSNIQRSLKGTTSQDIQVDFSFIHPEIREIQADHIENIILHVKKFTLEDDKIACLEIYEQEGGRHLKIKISNNELLAAIQL